MTAPITDTCIYRGEKYSLIAADNGRLISVKNLGVQPAMISTACWSGFYATYSIIGDSLALVRLVVGTRNNSIPPIGGIIPKYEALEHAWVYSGLQEKISYTGTIRLGKWPKQWREELGRENIAIYAGFYGDLAAQQFDQILDFSLDDGCILKIVDHSANIDNLEMNELNPRGMGTALY